MEPNSQHVGSDYAEGLISNMSTVNRKSPPQGDNVPGTAQPASFGHRLQQALRGGFHREPSRPDSSSGRGATALVANRSPFFLIAVALMAALALSLSLWLSGVLVQAQSAQTTVEYLENSTDEVATFSASDPEGATPVTWSLVPEVGLDVDGEGDISETGVGGDIALADAVDQGDFKIDSRTGVLEFKSPPDFEDADGGQAEGNDEDAQGSNTYRVVVQATDGDAGPPVGPDNLSRRDTRSWFKVIVNVRDVEELESVKLHPGADPAVVESAPVTLLQPQVGVAVSASVAGGDGTISARSYQWYRASNMTSDGTAITGASGPTAISYTPVHEANGASDIGQHLRVVVSYNDARGGGKRSETVSMYPTIGSVLDNASPTFGDGETTIRGVRENAEKGTNISHPVDATDPESKLTYWLSAGDGYDRSRRRTSCRNNKQ